MQYTNTILHIEQMNTSSNSFRDGWFSALSHTLLSGISMLDNAETTSTITLNCNGLEPISSHGICLLVKLLIYAKCQNKRLQVFGLSGHNRYVFEITRLNKFIDIIDSNTQYIEKVLLT
jgi:anti-anti-sigma factor